MQQKRPHTYGAVCDGGLYVGQLLSQFDVFLYLEYKVILGKQRSWHFYYYFVTPGKGLGSLIKIPIFWTQCFNNKGK